MKKTRTFKNIFRTGKVIVAATALAALFTGCGSNDQFVLTNTNLVAAPSAVNDAFQALGNATLNRTAANGVLANDILNGAGISAFDAVGSQGGTISLNSDGSFSYTPVAGFVGSETFTYTLSNDGGSSTATVTLTSTGLGRFVDNSAAANGTGTQASPFNNLASAVAAAQSGDTIFVDRGDGTSNNLSGAINLPAGVNLIGEGVGLILAQTIVPQGQAPILTGPITCGGNNTISGITVQGSADDAIIINGVGNVTISNNTLDSPGVEFIDCDNSTGTVTVSGNTFQNPNNNFQDVLSFFNTNVNGDIVVRNNVFLNAGNNNTDDLCQLIGVGTSVMNGTFSGNVANGTQADQFNYGLNWAVEDTSTLNVTVSDNTLNNFSSGPLSLASTSGGSTSGAISGNTISNSASVRLAPANGVLTVSGNVLTGDGTLQYGIDIADTNDGSTVRLLNNNISNFGRDGIGALFVQVGAINIALRNNTITGSGGDAFNARSLGTNTSVCFDITGNTVDDNIRINNSGSGVFDVERRDANEGGPLDATGVNTFTAGAPIYEGPGTVNSRPAGFCQIP